MNKTTVKQLSKALDVTQAAITQYLRTRNMVEELEKDGKRFLINQEQANEIVRHFTEYRSSCVVEANSDVTLITENDKTTVVSSRTTVDNEQTTIANDENVTLKALTSQLEVLQEQLKVKDEQINSLLATQRDLMETNKALSAANAASTIADKQAALIQPSESEVKSDNDDSQPTMSRGKAFWYWLTGNLE